MNIRILEEYEIQTSHGQVDILIKASIDHMDKITITFKQGADYLKIMNSDYDTVKALSKALDEAAEIVEARKVTAG